MQLRAPQNRRLQHVDTIAHDGKIVVIACSESGRLWYTVRRGGFEEAASPSALRDWEDLAPLPLPDANEGVDASVIEREEATLALPFGVKAGLTHVTRSRYDSRRLGAAGKPRLVSHAGVLHVFRQTSAVLSSPDPASAILVDRFVLDGLTNRLVRKLEVRFKRSRERYRPDTDRRGEVTDSLDFRDANRQPFLEPTTELAFLGTDIADDRWGVALVPTTDHDRFRWHIVHVAKSSPRVFLTSVASSPERLFDTRDRAGVPGIVRTELQLNGAFPAGAPVITRFDKQAEVENADGKRRLVRQSTHLMLALPVAASPAAAASDTFAMELDLESDGALAASRTAAPTPTLLRADVRDVQLPLDTIDNIRGIGAGRPLASAGIRSLRRAGTEGTRIEYEPSGDGAFADDAPVEISGAPVLNGRYSVSGVSFGELSEDLGRGDIALRLATTLTDHVSEGLRLAVRNTRGRLVGVVTTRRRRYGSRPRSRQIGIDEATFTAKAGYRVDCLDAFEIAADTGLGEVHERPAENEATLFAGQITGLERLSGGRVRVRAFDHGLGDDDAVRLDGVPRIDGAFDVVHGDDHVLLGARWPQAEAVNLTRLAERRRGLQLDKGVRASLPLPAGLHLAAGEATIECWLKTGGAATVFGHDGLALSVTAGGGLSLDVGSSRLLHAEQRVDDGRWHHVALVQRGDEARAVFVDGREATSGATSLAPHREAIERWTRTAWAGTERLTLGGAGTIAISELRVWGRVLEAAEIDRRRFLPVNGNELDLLGSWRLGAIVEERPRRLVDHTPNHRHGECPDEAYIGDRRLEATLADGSPVLRFENDDPIGVTGGATYEETIELRARSGGRHLEAAALEAAVRPVFSGRRSRHASDEIPHEAFTVLGTDLVRAAGPGWYRLTTRFTVPANAVLIRAFALALERGATLSDVMVRSVRLRRISASISRGDLVIPLRPPALTPADESLASTVATLREQESREAAIAFELRHTQARLRSILAGDIGTRLAAAETAWREAEQIRRRRSAELEAERNNPLNYVCFLLKDGRPLRAYTKEHKPGVHQIISSAPTTVEWANYLWSYDWTSGALHSDSPSKGVMAMYGSAHDFAMYAVAESGKREQRWDVFPAASDGGNGRIVLRNRQWQRVPWRVADEFHMKGIAFDVALLSNPQVLPILAAFFIDPRPTASASRFSKVPAARRALTVAEQRSAHALAERDRLRPIHANLAVSRRSAEQTIARLERERETLLVAIAGSRSRFEAATGPALGGTARGGWRGTRYWLLAGIAPRGAAHLADRSDGKVVLSYTDGDGVLREPAYAAAPDAADAGGFETWRLAPYRHCVELPSNGRIVLEPPVGGKGHDSSVELWMRFPVVPRSSFMLVQGGGSDSGDPLEYIHVHQYDERWLLTLSGAHEIQAFGDIDPGWHHLGIVFSGSGATSTTRLYVDGRLEIDWREAALALAEARALAEGDEARRRRIIEQAENQVYRIELPLSHVASYRSDGLPVGLLAEVRVWNLALSDEEIEINSRTLLGGREPGLVHYLPLDTHGGSIAGDGRARLEAGGVPFRELRRSWSARLGALSPAAAASAPVATTEYAATRIDADTRERSAMLRRLYATIADGALELLAEQRVEALELVWIGNAQFEPTLLGYIEGAPPIPSENLTEPTGVMAYNGATSVQLRAESELDLGWQRDQKAGLGLDLSVFFGSQNGFSIAGIDVADWKYGFRGNLSLAYSFLNSSKVDASSGQSVTDRVALHGSVETEPHFPELGKRFVPKNVGYALVVSGLADVYITRLQHTGTMVSYEVIPSPDVPPDVNTVTFMINPALTMAGSLDGMTGSRATSERFFRHVPAMRAQLGSRYPASYLRIEEATELQSRIEREDREREAFFANFDSRLVDQGSIDRQLEDGGDGGDLDKEAEKRREELRAQGQENEKAADAVAGLAAWQTRMEQLAVEAGKQNIVNTYVWDADGGLRAERQNFADTIRHTVGGSFSLSGSLGFEGEGRFLGTAAALTALATVHLTQTMTKTKTTRRAMSLDVDLSGVESRGVTDHRDRPLMPGEKVDRYRFKSFYLAGKTEHFERFFDEVVDPEWLASNDEEARTLRQIDRSRPNKCWRVLHRVTYVERPALLDFGSDLRPLSPPPSAPPATLDDVDTRLEQLAAELRRVKLSVNRIARDTAATRDAEASDGEAGESVDEESVDEERRPVSG